MNSEGLGLGLTIVQQIINRAGGSLEVFSEGKDQGSCFSFVMPMDVVEDHQTTQQKDSQLIKDKKARKDGQQ